MYSATVMLITDQQGKRCVVTDADPVIWIATELLDQARNPDREHIPGDMEINGDRIEFGTPGEGLGRLTYRLRPDYVYNANGPERWYVAEREDPTTAA